MSDRTYAKLQAQQKTLTGSSSSRHLLHHTSSFGRSSGIDRLCTECQDKQLTLHGSQRTLGVSIRHIPISPPIMDAVQRAATGNSRPLDESVRLPLEQSLRHNFSRVRVHYGPASSRAAEQLSARAYTLGSDIYLSNEAHQLSRPQYNRLLAHEAIHTVQQSGSNVAPQAKLKVSHPTDAAEIEADGLSESIISSAERSSTSRSLVLRDQLQVTPTIPATVSRVVAPLIQRDLKGRYPASNGTFTLDLETAEHELSYKGKRFPTTGMKGTIKFKASKKAPESMHIRLLQIARNEDLATGKEYRWEGKETARNELRTAEEKDKDIKPGYLVDILPPDRQRQDLPVSPYYRDYWPNEEKSHDGSNIGGMVHEASLWDFPRSWDFRRFSFETAARASDTGFTYATIRWGFTVAGPTLGMVTGEHASVHDEPSATFGAALKKFNEFYGNPPDLNEAK